MGEALRASLWAYPALEVVHIIGIALLFGSLMVLDLRLTGLGRALPLEALARLALPVSLGGFLLAAASGLVMFAADAAGLLTHPAFQLKFLLICAAGLNAALFHARGGLRKADGTAFTQAVLSLALWMGVIACGRAIAYV